MKPYLLKILFFVLLSSFLIPLAVSGQIRFENPLRYETFEELINALINFIFDIALAIAPLMIIIAGFYFVTAGGDPQRVKTAKNIILYTCIGLAIVLLARGLIVLLRQIFEVREETHLRNLVFYFPLISYWLKINKGRGKSKLR